MNMPTGDTQILFVALILPSLFALTFLAEGVHKVMEQEPPWVSFFIGFMFLGVIIAAYFLLFAK